MPSILQTMVMSFGAGALLLARMASAECVYKDVMSEQEISACRDAPAEPVENRKPRGDAPKSAAYREVERQIARDNEARHAEAEKANRPRLPVVGMSETQARQLPYPWGNPSMINKSTNEEGAHEQWVFPGRKYLYFQNGVLTLIEP